MTRDDLDAAVAAMAGPDDAAMAAAAARQATLTKPPGSLGRLEDLAIWLAGWQRRALPRLDHVAILVFAGNHGVAARGVSAYPASVTKQMVANFAAGGAAINQLAKAAGATLHVVSLDLDRPTADITAAPAMDERGFLAAIEAGRAAIPAACDLVCLGEMGIANTTTAAALAAGLFGGGGAAWAGLGTGVDPAGLARKAAAIDAALAHHAACLGDPLALARCLGGRELAAILGATIEARLKNIPVLLDGFVCTAAAAPLHALRPDGLDHAQIAHRSAEAGHQKLAAALGRTPLLDLGMRLGEGSGAAVAIGVLRAAAATHAGMASFAEAGIDDRPA